MPSSSSVLAFAALSFAVIIAPGPSVMFVVSRAVALGRRVALLTVLGNSAGLFLQVVLVAIGIGAVVEQSVAVFTVVKLVGAGYLVWLGIQAFRNRSDSELAVETNQHSTVRRSAILDGFIVGVANPKTIVFLAAILPQYVDAGGGPAGIQMAFLGSIFVAMALILDSAWGIVAGSARSWFASSPHRLERLSAGGGLVMIGLGLRLAVTGRNE
ncbi:MAG: LysE family translocator [Acidimicrobiales bacterium]